MKMQISRQPSGEIRAKFPEDNDQRYAVFIGGVFWGDFDEAEACEDLLKIISDVKKGIFEDGEWNGNSWRIIITKEEVLIQFQLDFDYKERFETNIFQRALEAWRDFLISDSFEEVTVDLEEK